MREHGDGRDARMVLCGPRVRAGAALPRAVRTECIHGVAVNDSLCVSTGRFKEPLNKSIQDLSEAANYNMGFLVCLHFQGLIVIENGGTSLYHRKL